MNKATLVQKLQDREDLNRRKAEKIVSVFFNSITQTLVDDDRVEIRGFCVFLNKTYKSYVGRNPKTGESIQVKEKKSHFSKRAVILNLGSISKAFPSASSTHYEPSPYFDWSRPENPTL